MIKHSLFPGRNSSVFVLLVFSPSTMAFKYFFSTLYFPRLFFLLISTAHFSSMLNLVVVDLHLPDESHEDLSSPSA